MAQCLFLGVALSITAVPVAVRMFMDLGSLDSRVGKAVIAAALWDDLLSLFLIALLLAAIGGQASGDFTLGNLLPVVGKVLTVLRNNNSRGLVRLPVARQIVPPPELSRGGLQYVIDCCARLRGAGRVL